MKLAVTIDVEEEGLFNGRYDSGRVPVQNVGRLSLLDPIFRELGIHPTLLLSYHVAKHGPSQELIRELNDKWGGEIGAHLHTWNTPPLKTLPYRDPVPSEMMPRDLLAAKLSALFEALEEMGVKPDSFRMGRFNMGPKMFSLLEDTRIRVDSSISPTRMYYGGPAHLSAPTDPYFPDPRSPARPGRSKILEAPITILPLVPGLGTFLEHMSRRRLLSEHWAASFSKFVGSIPAQPMWTGLNRIKTAAWLHRRRGGRVLTIFFHSSELMPGGCPKHQTERHIQGFLNKLKRFLSWVMVMMKAESVTLSELYGATDP